jgi:pimeloyl-ACP methyl ester carboxylesterase
MQSKVLRIINFLFFSSLLSFLHVLNCDEYNIPPSIRFTIEREESASPIVYYFSPPDTYSRGYPILILCEGSSSKGNIGSVFFIREYFAKRVQPLQVGYLTVEKWGVDGNHVDEKEFWCHYSRLQRLKDHLAVIDHLRECPPPGWSGELIFIGVSEGGPVVTDLSITCPDTLATINWVGAGDWCWADELWQFFRSWKQSSFWIRFYDAIPRWLPFSSDIPSTRQEFDNLIDYIINNPTPNQWLGGMTYLYHADAILQPPGDYSRIRSPFLVVKGTADSDIESSDQFVQKALQAGASITYFRVEGMDHWLRKRPDVIDQSFDWLEQQLIASRVVVKI